MKWNADFYLKKLSDDIIRDQKKLDNRRWMLSELPIALVCEQYPQGTWNTQWFEDFEFNLPMSFELIDNFKEFCKYQQYTIKNERTYIWDESDKAGTFFEVYVQDNLSFAVSFRSNVEGATCVLNKIGTKEVPVYEVICTAGAEENTFGG